MENRTPTIKLRRGYTTGACAAAAARAAAVALLEHTIPIDVRINLPDASQAIFNIHHGEFDDVQATCSVIKDAGDDPDITNGAEIKATVRKICETGIIVSGGEGVGKVTKPGLEIPAGVAAINPIPRKMIEQEVQDVFKHHPDVKGLEVTISVAGGEKLAKKTLNPRLGIIGGISIIGTTGIVIPYSPEAYKASIAQSISVAVACGGKHVVITTGRRSEKYAQAALELTEECFIQAGDFIGYAVEQCVKQAIAQVTIWGMTGKISKLAAGSLYTNISDSKVDISFLTSVAADCGIPEENPGNLQEAVTANHFRRLIPDNYVRRFCDKLCELAAKNCRQASPGELKVNCIMSDYNGTILGSYHGR